MFSRGHKHQEAKFSSDAARVPMEFPLTNPGNRESYASDRDIRTDERSPSRLTAATQLWSGVLTRIEGFEQRFSDTVRQFV